MSAPKQNRFLHYLWLFALSVKHWLSAQCDHAFSGRVIYWLPVFFAGGILIFFCSDKIPPLPVLFLLSTFLASVVWGLVYLGKRWLSGLFMAVLVVSLGLVWVVVKTSSMDVVLLNKGTGVTKLIGSVEAVQANDKGKRVLLKDIVYEKDLTRRDDLDLPERIRLQSYHAQDLVGGMRVEVLANLMPPAAPSLPGGFDFRRYAYFQNIGAVGYTLSDFTVIEHEPRAFFQFFSKLRESINARLAVIEDESRRGVAMALFTGERSAVPDETLNAIRDAGIAHLLAISGLHVGLVAGFVFLVIRLGLAAIPSLALYWPIKKIAAIFALCAAVFYMLLVGAPVPTQRAVIMTGLVFIAILFDRNAISFRLAALAAMFVLLIRPQSIVEVSFQLSFAAVLSLIAFYTFLKKRYSDWMYTPHIMIRPLLYFWGVILTTLIASLATAPLTLYHFQHFALYSHLSNLIAVPVTSFVVMPFGVIAMLLMPFGAEGLVLPVIEQGIATVVDSAIWVAQLQGAVLKMPLIPPAAITVFCLGGLFLLLCRASVLSLSLFLCSLFLAAVVFWSQTSKRPDIFIDNEAALVGVVQEGKLLVSSMRKNTYGREQWVSSLGWSDNEVAQNPNCDEWGCVWMDVRGVSIGWVGHIYGLAKACEQSDIVIYAGWMDYDEADKCLAGYLVDKRMVSDLGAMVFYVRQDGVEMRSVKGVSLNKPWTQ